jgi:hypothetical protein
LVLKSTVKSRADAHSSAAVRGKARDAGVKRARISNLLLTILLIPAEFATCAGGICPSVFVPREVKRAMCTWYCPTDRVPLLQ